MSAPHNIFTVVRAWFAIRPANQHWGTFHPQESTISQQALKMGVKVPEIKYDFWRERDISGTNGTKREKYSGVNAAIDRGTGSKLTCCPLLQVMPSCSPLFQSTCSISNKNKNIL